MNGLFTYAVENELRIKKILFIVCAILLGCSVFYCINIKEKVEKRNFIRIKIADARCEEQTLRHVQNAKTKSADKVINREYTSASFLDEVMLQGEKNKVTIESISTAEDDSNSRGTTRGIFLSFRGDTGQIFNSLSVSAGKLPAKMQLVRLAVQSDHVINERIVQAEFRNIED